MYFYKFDSREVSERYQVNGVATQRVLGTLRFIQEDDGGGGGGGGGGGRGGGLEPWENSLAVTFHDRGLDLHGLHLRIITETKTPFEMIRGEFHKTSFVASQLDAYKYFVAAP